MVCSDATLEAFRREEQNQSAEQEWWACDKGPGCEGSDVEARCHQIWEVDDQTAEATEECGLRGREAMEKVHLVFRAVGVGRMLWALG